jgi:hypothetical protein
MGTVATNLAGTTALSTPERVAALRDLAGVDAVGAQDAAWAWFERLGREAATDRVGAADRLADLFACGQPSRDISGPTDGILVAPLIHPRVDALARAVTRVWMPWQGKRFDAEAGQGDNRLVGSFALVGRLLWPLYSSRPGPTGRLAFDFETRIERGAIEPAVDVLVIDYAPVAGNPGLLIRSIRDELVDVVPGTHLGRILHRRGDVYDNWGYFALRTATG